MLKTLGQRMMSTPPAAIGAFEKDSPFPFGESLEGFGASASLAHPKATTTGRAVVVVIDPDDIKPGVLRACARNIGPNLRRRLRRPEPVPFLASAATAVLMCVLPAVRSVV
jgi:hypothetical protein